MSDGSAAKTIPRSQTAKQIFLRGLAISLPAVLTIVILLWLLGGISAYIINPTTASVKYVIAQFLDRSIELDTANLRSLKSRPTLPYAGTNYLVTEDFQREYQRLMKSQRRTPVDVGDEADLSLTTLHAALDDYFTHREDRLTWIEQQAAEQPAISFFADAETPSSIYVPLGGRGVPYADYEVVARDTPAGTMPTTATGLYMEYAVRRYVGSAFTLSVIALSLVIIGIYFLGRFVSVRLGSWVIHQIESRLLSRLPVIRNVYGSAKQVTEFLFSENQVEYRRVIALEYPRRGLWSLGLVTGEGMLEITTAIGEPCLSILIPSSPMPVTGYTMCVPRSAVLDLDLTVDQAFQFCISCGVLVPPQQKVTAEILQQELTRQLAERMREPSTDRRPITPTAPTSATTTEVEEDDDEERSSRR